MPTAWWQPAERYVAPHDVHRAVGARLHALRLEAEVTVAELERRAGIHRARIRYYERGGVMTLPVLARLAHALELEVVDLVWDLRHPPPAARWRRPRTHHVAAEASPPRAQAPRISARPAAAPQRPASAAWVGGLAAVAD
jgi:transcriptional regulator with XRE-family HTH domain